jgi:ribosomal protein S27E
MGRMPMPQSKMKNGFLDNIPEVWDGQPKRRKKPVKKPGPEDVFVEYVKVKCPNCKSTKTQVYNTNYLPIRYHKCLKCGFRFKSVENTA